MPFLRKKVFYDTQVISYALAGKIPAADWELACRYVSARCRYCVSLNTLTELIVGLACGDEAHFSENVNRIKFLCVGGDPVFLPLVGEFIRKRVFHLNPIRPDYSPAQIKMWPRIIINARDRSELISGLVSLREPGRRLIDYGFNLEMLVRQVQDGKNAHSHALSQLRDGTLLRPTQQQWALGVLCRLAIPISDANVARLCSTLDAAYQYDTQLYDLALCNNYDFTKHDSDWLDTQQLYYLADPSVFLVTLDSKLKARTAKSSQIGQVLDFEDLKAVACRRN